MDPKSLKTVQSWRREVERAKLHRNNEVPFVASPILLSGVLLFSRAALSSAVVVVLGPVQRLVRLAVAAHPRLADVGHRGSPNVVDVVEGDDVIAIINTTLTHFAAESSVALTSLFCSPSTGLTLLS